MTNVRKKIEKSIALHFRFTKTKNGGQKPSILTHVNFEIFRENFCGGLNEKFWRKSKILEYYT